MSSKFVKVMNLYYTHTNRCTLIQIQIMSKIIIDSISFFALLALVKNVYGFFLHIWAKKSQYFIWSSANALDIDAMRSIFKYWRQQQFNSNYCKLANFVSQLDCSVTQKCEKHAKQKQNSWLCVYVYVGMYIFLPSGDENKNSKQNLKALFKVEHIERQQNKYQNRSSKRERERETCTDEQTQPGRHTNCASHWVVVGGLFTFDFTHKQENNKR